MNKLYRVRDKKKQFRTILYQNGYSFNRTGTDTRARIKMTKKPPPRVIPNGN